MSAPAAKQALILFTKAPALGKVKTRMAAQMGDEATLELYLCMLSDTIDACRGGNWDILAFLQVTDDSALHEQMIPEATKVFSQQGGTLGQRMRNAFARAFELGYDRCAIVGGDCPELTRQDLERGFAALDEADVSIAPAFDGGYCFLGMRRFLEEAFALDDYGHGLVARQTVELLQSAGNSCQLLPIRYDIDTWEDARQLLGRANTAPELGKLRTVAMIKRLHDEG